MEFGPPFWMIIGLMLVVVIGGLLFLSPSDE
jgi:hypothetical protein